VRTQCDPFQYGFVGNMLTGYMCGFIPCKLSAGHDHLKIMKCSKIMLPKDRDRALSSCASWVEASLYLFSIYPIQAEQRIFITVHGM